MYKWYIIKTSPSPFFGKGDIPPYLSFNLSIFYIMDRNLTFKETLTVEQFKQETLVSNLKIKRNPKTNKLFFTYGGKTGAVASAGIPENPMVSLVETPEGESFWLLHNEGQGAEVLATL